MFKLVLFLFKLVLSLFNKNIFEILEMIAITKKENEILKRQVNHVKYTRSDKIFFVLCLKLFKHCKDYITLVRPETILKWYRNLIKRFWTFTNESSKAGRPVTPKYIRDLILEMKNNNLILCFP